MYVICDFVAIEPLSLLFGEDFFTTYTGSLYGDLFYVSDHYNC